MRYDAMLSAMVSGKKKQKWQVFLSHSGEDTWIARQIAREISERGAVPFLDEADVDVGAEFEEDIRRSAQHGYDAFRSSWFCWACPPRTFRRIRTRRYF